MNRAKFFLMFAVVVSGLLVSAESSFAQEQYTIEIYVAEAGYTPQDAKTRAYDELADVLADTIASLPPGHTVPAISYIDEGYLEPLVYFIEVELLVEVGGKGGGL